VTMSLREALEVVAQHRGQRIVISTMASIAVWPQLSDTGLDFAYIPSAMGQGPALGVGLALAQPEHGAIVINGDGSTLMNLGSLVTLANQPANVHLVIIDNGIYEVTGGQAMAGSGHTDFAAIARGAGIKRVFTFETAAAWSAKASEAFSQPGPSVIVLKIEARMGQKTPLPPRPMPEQISRLCKALGL
jgi:sulfopyruvate decarboxylase subunit beta